jgi:hypothetical protein
VITGAGIDPPADTPSTQGPNVADEPAKLSLAEAHGREITDHHHHHHHHPHPHPRRSRRSRLHRLRPLGRGAPAPPLFRVHGAKEADYQITLTYISRRSGRQLIMRLIRTTGRAGTARMLGAESVRSKLRRRAKEGSLLADSTGRRHLRFGPGCAPTHGMARRVQPHRGQTGEQRRPRPSLIGAFERVGTARIELATSRV